jgi:hypothetical protein
MEVFTKECMAKEIIFTQVKNRSKFALKTHKAMPILMLATILKNR